MRNHCLLHIHPRTQIHAPNLTLTQLRPLIPHRLHHVVHRHQVGVATRQVNFHPHCPLLRRLREELFIRLRLMHLHRQCIVGVEVGAVAVDGVEDEQRMTHRLLLPLQVLLMLPPHPMHQLRQPQLNTSSTLRRHALIILTLTPTPILIPTLFPILIPSHTHCRRCPMMTMTTPRTWTYGYNLGLHHGGQM